MHSGKECFVCLCITQNMYRALGVTAAREIVRLNRIGKPDDFLNSVIGGFGSGAIIGCCVSRILSLYVCVYLYALAHVSCS